MAPEIRSHFDGADGTSSAKYLNLRKTVTNVVVIVIESEKPYVVIFFWRKRFTNNQEAFRSRVKGITKSSQEHIYDEPSVEDKHYLIFEEYNPEIHDQAKSTMLTQNEDEGTNKLKIKQYGPIAVAKQIAQKTPQKQTPQEEQVEGKIREKVDLSQQNVQKLGENQGEELKIQVRNMKITWPRCLDVFAVRKRSNSVSSTSSSDTSVDLPRTEKHTTKKSRSRKMDEVERLAEMERQRRQREAEQRLIEEETAKRIEELVKKRVEEELEKRKDEIEKEVTKRVEEAKRIMEKQMMEDLERRREKQREEEKRREEEEQRKQEMVERILEENQRKIEEAQRKLAEERLAMVEEQRKMDEERQRLRKEQEKRVKEEQKKILGKNNSRPKLSFSLKPVL
ncbi:hypothetical protein GEV33_011566 [Tenebrio molitor]|uniref:Uncharacterized protein n=1 Tax=Tenebrio molitor TaxID=7067 RepID=A0A8J6H3P9_TENMO|nr:hypothetical protein GEV33_011566 [Tenebrio molitor]